ncbi:MAG: 4-hydroxy-3-polyprenylbenzoate decarboxylase [Chlamydiales bacterium]
MSRVFVGITGASGHIYAQRLIMALARIECDVDLSITAAGLLVLRQEFELDAGERGERLPQVLEQWLGPAAQRVRTFRPDEVGAPPASGTARTGGTVIAPCSMGTLARIAAGFSSNLVERAADVALKERRRLVLLPRETPLSAIHLENMLKLTRMGAVVLPAMPGFYHRPKSIDELVDHVVGKLLDTLAIEHAVGARWTGLEPNGDPGTQPPGGESP